MPNGLKNWKHRDVVAFLRQHFFIGQPGKRTGHQFYKGLVDGGDRLVEVQYSSKKGITPKSLQHDIIPPSGIPESYWKDWAKAGNKKARKKVQYQGAEKRQ